MKRIRVQLEPIKRSNDYLRLRYWWLAELRTLRAKRRYGNATKKDLKIAQRELARVRKDH